MPKKKKDVVTATHRPWMVVTFPVAVRREFVRQSSVEEVTVPELLEKVVRKYLLSPDRTFDR